MVSGVCCPPNANLIHMYNRMHIRNPAMAISPRLTLTVWWSRSSLKHKAALLIDSSSQIPKVAPTLQVVLQSAIRPVSRAGC